LTITCPHCGAAHIAFPVRAEYQNTVFTSQWEVFLTCGSCSRAIAAAITGDSSGKATNMDGNRIYSSPKEVPGDIEFMTFIVAAISPELADLTAPDDTPPKISDKYIQSDDNLRRGNWDAAGTMYRKAVELSTIDLGGTKKLFLVKRIDELADKQAIMPDMKKWAHKIRQFGNTAAHDEFEEDEARALQKFTELFLTYVYTLPGMVKAATQKPAPEESDAPEA
jgi:hypothetical protein